MSGAEEGNSITGEKREWRLGGGGALTKEKKKRFSDLGIQGPVGLPREVMSMHGRGASWTLWLGGGRLKEMDR